MVGLSKWKEANLYAYIKIGYEHRWMEKDWERFQYYHIIRSNTVETRKITILRLSMNSYYICSFGGNPLVGLAVFHGRKLSHRESEFNPVCCTSSGSHRHLTWGVLKFWLLFIQVEFTRLWVPHKFSVKHEPVHTNLFIWIRHRPVVRTNHRQYKPHK